MPFNSQSVENQGTHPNFFSFYCLHLGFIIGFNLNFVFGATPLDPCRSTTHSSVVDCSLVVDATAVESKFVIHGFQLFLL